MKAILMLLQLLALSIPTDRARIAVTRTNMRILQTAVTSFQEASGRLPTQEEGLSVLIHKPADWPGSLPWETFLETPELPCDVWGNEFGYVLNSDWPEGFGIYSCGRDGVTLSLGNDYDDLNTWNTQAPWNDCYRIQTERREAISSAVSLVIILLIIAAVFVLLWKGSQDRSTVE